MVQRAQQHATSLVMAPHSPPIFKVFSFFVFLSFTNTGAVDTKHVVLCCRARQLALQKQAPPRGGRQPGVEQGGGAEGEVRLRVEVGPGGSELIQIQTPMMTTSR